MREAIDKSQRHAAVLVGIMYLLALPLAIFAEFYVPNQLAAAASVDTAQNIVAHERLFRMGIAANAIVFALDAILITGLYVILSRVSNPLALLAAMWRLIETVILATTAASDLTILKILGRAEYMQVFGAGQLQALVRLLIGAHGTAYSIGLFFFGLGGTLFGCLWFHSRYVPRTLAAFGVFASAIVAVRSGGIVVFPEMAVLPTAAWAGPIFIFELAMGLWLVIEGLRATPPATDEHYPPGTSAPSRQGFAS